MNILIMVYNLRFFSSKCSLFHNSNVFGSCIIHILYTGCAKIKKKNSGAKSLTASSWMSFYSRRQSLPIQYGGSRTPTVNSLSSSE